MEAMFDSVIPFAWSAAKVNALQFIALFVFAAIAPNERDRYRLTLAFTLMMAFAMTWVVAGGLLILVDIGLSQ